MSSMYDLLMSMPLFHGVSHEKISEVIESTKFHFLKYHEGDTIVDKDEPCTHIKFIISGRVESTIEYQKKGLSVSQTIDAPDVITPDFLFGRTTLYPCTVKAVTPTGIMQISKADYMTLLCSDNIFMFNFLNLLSSNSQKGFDGAIATCGNALEKNIAFKILALTQSRGYNISLTCNNGLASMFCATETQLFAALDSLRQRNILDFDSHQIRVLYRPGLIKILAEK